MERQIPKNVRQIGNVSDSPKIYVEDYVDTFFLQLSEKSEKEKQPEGAFLIGEMQKQDNEEYIYIYGAIKIKELKKEGGEYLINDRPDYKFELGKGVVLREGKDLTIIATGLPVSNCLEAAEKLAADGIDAKVINIHTIKPLDEELVVAAAKETGKVVTVEEHYVIGGLGSAVCDVVAEKAPAKVMKIGVNDTFGESGPAVELIKKYGLDADSIYAKVKEFVK